MTMGVVRGCVVMCLSAGCISPVMHFGGGKSAKEAQHDTMSDLAPVRLVPESKWGGEIATRTIRVWADDQYRAQTVRWQRSFEEPLELANLVLTPLFGLRLVPEYHVWERHAAGGTLAADLEALAERDPGHDVLIVIGLTSSLPLLSATFDELGSAVVGGRHLIVRGYADLEERKLYADAFRDLLPEERELALEARRHHKTAVVLLHEIAHTFGADHEVDQGTIMNASYSHRASAFSPRVRDVMLRTIDQRLGRASSTGEAREPTATIEPKPQAPVRTGPLVFYITSSGNVEIDGKVIEEYEVDNLLEAARARDRNTEIIIMRSRSAPTAALGKVFDRAMAIKLKVSISLY
jgi:hypothetical protein